MESAAETVCICGKAYPIRRSLSSNRTASAKLKGGAIHISVPARWPKSEKERISSDLLGRAVKAIEKGRWKEEQCSRVLFSDGQKVVALGREMEITFIPANRFGSRLAGGRLEVRVVENHPKKAEMASRLARKRIVEMVRQELVGRVCGINDMHFQSVVPKVTVRDNTSRWGSCSRDGSISLNFRLLFMPQDILDYVIIHELAHTKYRSHGVRFWSLVEKIVPDHREKRRWLREKGWTVPESGIKKNSSGGMGAMMENTGPAPQGEGRENQESGQSTPGGMEFEYDEPY